METNTIAPITARRANTTVTYRVHYLLVDTCEEKNREFFSFDQMRGFCQGLNEVGDRYARILSGQRVITEHEDVLREVTHG